MRVRLLADAAEFLDTTLALRASDPLRTNVLGSVATSVVAGRHYERELWLVAEDDGAPVGAAMWTLPHKLVVSPCEPEVARALAAAAAAAGGPVHGAIVPVEIAAAVAEGAAARAVPAMRERLLVLGRYVAPPPVPGGLRQVGEADVDEAVRWLDAFTAEARVLAVDNRAAVRSSLGRLWFWEVDGTAVSMAGHAPLVESPGGTVGRVGPVFTPAEHRNRRFGSVITAAVVERLLETCDLVMLYTDASNATSNAVYERLGFEHVADIVDLDLVPR